MAAATLDLHVVINYKILPLVPHKAAAEVSEIGNHRKPIGELGCCESRMAEWWLELCFFWSGYNGCSGHLVGHLAAVVVVVVSWSCSCGVV